MAEFDLATVSAPPKRQDKYADPNTQLEVDTHILEYLIYTATSSLLGDAESRTKSSNSPPVSRRTELTLEMVDCKPRVLLSSCIGLPD